MTPEEIVLTRLNNIAAVTALVSTRVYLDKLPQSPTYPCVRVTLISEVGTAHLRGENKLTSARVQVDAYAREVSGVDPYALALAVANAVQGDGAGSGLGGFTGDIGSPAARVQAIYQIERRRSYDPDELRVLCISQDYSVWATP